MGLDPAEGLRWGWGCGALEQAAIVRRGDPSALNFQYPLHVCGY